MKSMGASAREIANFLISNAADNKLAIGPLVWQPSDGTASKVWYFIVGSADAEKQFRHDQIVVSDEADYMAILLELVGQRAPLVVHTFDSELDMAKWCAAIWPCERSNHIKARMEMEHKDAQG